MEEGKKKEQLFKRIGKDLRLQIWFCVLSMFMLMVAYIPLLFCVEQYTTEKKIMKTVLINDKDILTDVTEVTSSGKKILFSGWVIRLDAKIQDIKVILSPLNTEIPEEIILKTTLRQNDIVQKYINYLQEDGKAGCDFEAELDQRELQENVCYELFVYVEFEYKGMQTVKISSQRYLYNEQIYSHNPIEFTAPIFSNNEMRKIVKTGDLLGYNIEHGVWIYKYGGDLYWILDKSIEKNLNKNLCMFFHLNTSMPEALSEERKRYGFDNRDFMFYSKEIMLEEEDYRVAKESISVEYPLTWLSTGEYDILTGTTEWSIRFHICNE